MTMSLFNTVWLTRHIKGLFTSRVRKSHFRDSQPDAMYQNPLNPVPLIVLLGLLMSFAPVSHGYHFYEQLRHEKLWNLLLEPGSVALLSASPADALWPDQPANPLECRQRPNLSSHGINSAKRYFRSMHLRGINEAMVYASTDCEALQTAFLLELGAVHHLPLLNRIEGTDGLPAELLAGTLKRWIEAHSNKHLVVLVTYDQVITELTGVEPDPNDLVILSRDKDKRLFYEGKVPLLSTWSEKTDAERLAERENRAPRQPL